MGKKRSRAAVRDLPMDTEPLFHAMADEGPGLLSVLSVSPSGLVRMRHDVSSPGGRRFRRDFSVRSSTEHPGLVQVRVPGYPNVVVSPVPSAVLAVALR